MAKVSNVVKGLEPTFADVRDWHNRYMHPSVMDFDDQKPYEVYSEGKFAGVFQCTGQGAQRLFMNAKPKSITDIACLTSIYRPGPLGANVDKLWLKHEHIPYDWGHPLLNETLKDTRGLLIFQEGVMNIANKVAGFPMQETDDVRRIIVKRSLPIEKMKEFEDRFIQGCVKNGVPEKIALNAYETIKLMASYGFNRSHAVAYAIDSYWCAWLLTYFEAEWLISYIESTIDKPEKKIKAISEVKRLGYKIASLDINLSEKTWTVIEGKRFIPSLTSCKGIGDAAFEEVLSLRPYKSIEDFLWNEDGSWKHSKFNKRSIEALIKICAFESLDCVGEDKLFNSYRHMYEVIINNIDDIKKSTKKDPHMGRKKFYELVRTVGRLPEWTRKELVENQMDVFGNLDVSTLIAPETLEHLIEKNVKTIDEWDNPEIYWFCVQECEPKKTKTGKNYLDITVVGLIGKTYKIKVWNWDGKKVIDPYTLMVAQIDRNDFGFSASYGKMKELR